MRDVKAYRDSKNYRKIPVGYSAGRCLSKEPNHLVFSDGVFIADISELRPMLQNYLSCGNNATESVDFFGLNAYEWCGRSSFSTSGYSMLEANATDYNVPIFFSETGCNTVRPRTFADQGSILGDNMSNTWSGAIIYEWIEEMNNYGLISYGPKGDAATATNAPDGYPRSGTPTPVQPDFGNLKSQWAAVTPSGVKLSVYSASATKSPPECPSSTAGGWAIDGKSPLPTLGQTLNRGAASATPTGSTTGASPSGTKKGSASGGKEIAGMGVGLAGVLLGFIVWL